MTGNGNQYAGNPFSAVAVAITTDAVAHHPMIETSAVRKAEQELRQYLASTPLAGAGNVIAVSGDHGTGKTHLGVRLVQVAHAESPSASAMYLDVASDQFTGLYRRFIANLGREGIRARVNDFYADVVADSLSTGTTVDIAALVRNREIEPDDVVGGYQMMESALLRQVTQDLKNELSSITDNQAYATALALLLRPGFDDVVWDWFNGSAPHAALVERGVTHRIDDEVAALDALGVFALLHGRKGRPFVLVVDEIDKILTGRDITTPVNKALQRLLQVFQAAGSFLVLSGLPESRRELEPDVAQRISTVIPMPPLLAGQVSVFVDLAQRRESDLPYIEFPDSAVERMVKLANGNPRKIISLCHALYRTAVEQRRSAVDTLMVEEAMHDRAGYVTTDEVTAAIRDLLVRENISYSTDQYVGNRDSFVDFWIEAGPDSGFAVLVAESVFTGDVDDLVIRARAVRSARETVEVVLVVANVLDADAAQQLTAHVLDKPVRYDPRSFTEDFQPLLRSLRQRYTGSPLDAIREWLVRIDLANATTRQMMEKLDRDLSRLSEETSNELMTLRERTNVVNIVTNTYPGDDPAGQPFPDSVAEVFHDALAGLDRLGYPDTLFDRVLGRAEDASEHYRRVTQMLNRLATKGVYEAAGTVSMLRRWITSFSNAAASWYATESHAARRPGQARSRLDALCRTYERVAETMPLGQIAPLVQLVAEGEADPIPKQISTQLVQRQVTEFAEQYRTLGGKVREMVLAELSAP